MKEADGVSEERFILRRGEHLMGSDADRPRLEGLSTVPDCENRLSERRADRKGAESGDPEMV